MVFIYVLISTVFAVFILQLFLHTNIATVVETACLKMLVIYECVIIDYIDYLPSVL